MVAQDAARAYAGVKALRKLVNVEDKAYSTHGASNATIGGTVTLLTGIPQGDGHQQRDGNSVRLHKFRVWMSLVLPTTLSSAQTRIIILRDHMANGAAPAISDVLETATYYSGYIDTQLFQDRFKVLFDKTVCQNAFYSGSDGQAFAGFELKGESHVHFVGTGATYLAAGQGSIWMLLIGSNGAYYPTVNWGTYMRYYDN
jgi:hypothetical protein